MITFKAFLKSLAEATGDKKFDDMMKGIEDKGKKSAEFGSKLKDMADSLPAEIDRQKKLESWVRDELKKIETIPNKMLAPFAKALKPLTDGYQKGTSLLDVLMHNDVTKFASHYHMFKNTVEYLKHHLKD